MANKAIINEVGLEISIKVDIDLSDNTSLELRYTKPDGSTGKWINPLVTYVLDNTQHFVRYTTQNTTDVDQAGIWYFQVRAIGNGYDLYGTRARYTFAEKMAGTF